MYRVELKGFLSLRVSGFCSDLFLMYRVELKVKVRGTIILDKEVPNVPCGVESQG